MKNQTLTAIGLMSGTSMDGIDAAVLRTDGDRVEGFGPSIFAPYEAEFRSRLRSIVGHYPTDNEKVLSVTEELTDQHISIVNRLIYEKDVDPLTVDVIGFHGHTVFHKPEQKITCQIGDGARLAERTGIPVVCDFRSNDIANGGEGAPLAPVFHAALSWNYEKPLAVLNIGGVANVTWISPDGGLIAFDTGPGNALIDDWVRNNKKGEMDIGGKLAHSGKINEESLARLLDNPYFLRPFPKSLDRNAFDPSPVAHLSIEDGAATLSAFSASAVKKAVNLFPSKPNRWLVCGGGRLNLAIMSAMRELLMQPVEPVEMAGWNGDALEAQAFAYLAVRSLAGKYISLPSTTGVSQPVSGGILYQPKK